MSTFKVDILSTWDGSQSVAVSALASGTVRSVSGPIGYATGAGGTVTQDTSKGTQVTLNKPCGRITTHNSALAAGATVSFGFLNSTLDAGDSVIVNGSNAANYDVKAGIATPGGVTIFIRNTTGGTLSDALTIDFKVIKGAYA